MPKNSSSTIRRSSRRSPERPAQSVAGALLAAGCLLAACSSLPRTADPLSDAPEARAVAVAAAETAASYAEALKLWRGAEDLNAWVGATFEYDATRAAQLSETQRARSGRLAIHTPEEFFANPRGVCVDLARFAVETLRVLDPQAKPSYLMIEFAPLTVAGNTLRLHWMATQRRAEGYYFFADSKRPGYMAGPYATVSEFVGEYAQYRGRDVVRFRELDSYERKRRTIATKQRRADAAPAPGAVSAGHE